MFKLDMLTVISTSVIIVSALLAGYYIVISEKNGKLLQRSRWIDQLPSLISTLGARNIRRYYRRLDLF